MGRITWETCQNRLLGCPLSTHSEPIKTALEILFVSKLPGAFWKLCSGLGRRGKECRRIRAGRAERIITGRSGIGSQMLGAQTGKEANGFGNEVVIGDLNGTVLVKKRARDCQGYRESG